MPRYVCLGGAPLAEHFACEGEHRQMAGAFNGAGDLALVFGACACLPAGANLALIGDKALQQTDIFVVDHDFFVSAKLALTWTGVESPAPIPAPTRPSSSVSRSRGPT